MKGISHFASGIAAATFIPGAVAAATSTHPFIMLLAGVFGLLPDWLDDRFGRYFERAREDISPDPAAFDAEALARRVADALDRAFTGQPVTVQVHTLPLGVERYRQYTLRFDGANNEVIVALGPVVDRARRPLTPVPGGPVGRARVSAKLDAACDGELKIDIYEGPSFECRRAGESLAVIWLPWRRRWSHSLVLGVVFGMLLGLAFGQTAGLVTAAAYCTHILGDQLGHLGSNLWWPFTARRSAGLRLLHSSDPVSNFFTVWISAMLVLFNLNAYAPRPQFNGNVFLIWAVLLPGMIMLAAIVYEAREKRRLRAEAATEQATPAEAEEHPV